MRRFLLPSVFVASLCSASCAHPKTAAFPLAPAMWRDTDLDSIDGACKPDPAKPSKLICGPPEYESSFAWDAADNTLFRPLSQSLDVAAKV